MNSNIKPIFVTQPSLPDLDELTPFLKQIWANKYVTNNGPLHRQLEEKLCQFLGVEYISLFCNGTIALLIAMRALRLTGEVITTPYSFVATAHSIKWNNLTPVFVDIGRNSCNIDPEQIERSITENTTAIMPVHVYGNPCETKRIQQIADKHKLKVIYDAAHSFGVRVRGDSVLNAGDLSVLSFHGTKVYNTFEGGAIICHSLKMKQRIDDLKNFSFQDETTVTGLGINGKMNEFQAALGLVQLKYFENDIKKRSDIDLLYRERLDHIEGISFGNSNKKVIPNYSYFPIFIDEKNLGISRDELYIRLKEKKIFSRRYFYPLISDFQEYKNPYAKKAEVFKNAKKRSEEVLCLPIFPNLEFQDVIRVVSTIKESIDPKYRNENASHE